MKLRVFPNPLLLDWFSNNSFHLFTPYGGAKNDIKKKKPPTTFVMLQRKAGSKSPRSKTWWLLRESPRFSGIAKHKQEASAGVFALILPYWVVLGKSFYLSGFSQHS